MNSYKLLLPNEKSGIYRYITLFIFLINFLVFAFVFFISSGNIKYLSLAGAMFSVASLSLFFTKYSKRSVRFEIACLILAIIWLLAAKYILATLLIVCTVTGIYTNRKPEILISKDKIIFPSFPGKVFRWDEVTNVMLKDDIITIDLKNNTLIQTPIDKQSGINIDEQEFNTFCNENIIASAG